MMAVESRTNAPLSARISAAGPKWIEKIYSSESGQDFLGLRAVQASMTDYLLPGVTTITPRARYFSFYSWVLHEYGRRHPDGWSLRRFLRRREQIFILANIAGSASDDDYPMGLAGSDKLSNHWRSHRSSGMIPLDDDAVTGYLAARYGGFDAYRGVVRSLGIMRTPDDATTTLHLLPKGQHLAEAYAAAIGATEYGSNPAAFDLSASIPVTILSEYGKACSLDKLADKPDCAPIRDLLLATDAATRLAPPNGDADTRGNMTGTMGMILDMVSQSSEPLTESSFRKLVAYGLADDYTAYTPDPAFRAFVARWQMFQLREYYVYALYGFFGYFLRWLEANGPQSLTAFIDHLATDVHLDFMGEEFGLDVGHRSLEDVTIQELIDVFLAQGNLVDELWPESATTFASQSNGEHNEATFHVYLERCSLSSPRYVVGIVLLFVTLYIRLVGLRRLDDQAVWQWAAVGGKERCSLLQFVRRLDIQLEERQDLLVALTTILRQDVIGQHMAVALEKWRDRKINTFHFTYDNGLFEWLANESAGFSASRIRQAYDMLRDLGLFAIEDGDGVLRLTEQGRRVLKETKVACHGG